MAHLPKNNLQNLHKHILAVNETAWFYFSADRGPRYTIQINEPNIIGYIFQ